MERGMIIANLGVQWLFIVLSPICNIEGWSHLRGPLLLRRSQVGTNKTFPKSSKINLITSRKLRISYPIQLYHV